MVNATTGYQCQTKPAGRSPKSHSAAVAAKLMKITNRLRGSDTGATVSRQSLRFFDNHQRLVRLTACFEKANSVIAITETLRSFCQSVP